jgi:glucosamine kinase
VDKLLRTKYYIGIDGGGSKTHGVLLNQDLKIIDEEYAGPANIRNDVNIAYTSICSVVDGLLKRHSLPGNEVKIGVGVAGYSVVDKRNTLQSMLHEKYVRVLLNSDCHIACLAAHHNQDGAIIICGTGVVGYSIDNGETEQFGGWGFPHGDLGGGAFLGLEIARVLCKAIEGVIPWTPTLHELYDNFFMQDSFKCKMWLINASPGDYAKIAQFVFTSPSDKYTQLILERGIDEISQFIVVIAKHNLPLKLVGGLARLYIGKLQKKYPALSLSEAAPAIGAASMVFYG